VQPDGVAGAAELQSYHVSTTSEPVESAVYVPGVSVIVFPTSAGGVPGAASASVGAVSAHAGGAASSTSATTAAAAVAQKPARRGEPDIEPGVLRKLELIAADPPREVHQRSRAGQG
jgi:hypothetical protein